VVSAGPQRQFNFLHSKMHIDINYWLDQLNLPQYQPLFQQYIGVQVIEKKRKRFD
jgi:hypothetical protein